MLETTRTAAAAIFKADPTMTPEEIKWRLAANRHAESSGEPLDEIIIPREAVRLIGKDRHTVAGYARRGLIRAVRTGGKGNRVTGYTRSSIAAFLSGKAQVA